MTDQPSQVQTTESTKQWFVLRVASNREDQVREALERKVKMENLGDLIGRILVPRERIKRVKSGQQKVAEHKLYPGYVFVEMQLKSDGEMEERAWDLFKETRDVGDFIGQKNRPEPIKPKEVEKIIAEAEKPEAGPTVKVDFQKGDRVKIWEGPFENFEGNVDEIFPDKGVVRVIVTIFGRATPLEVEYWQLEKMQ
ncbi:MAG: transcription termination/antitermination protein NusG [Planctomycetes bacterium]|jgi:transcriptional antiterminator NusG|nr:transcription termination/antitermination protein NusG [Planctomycetota bacterium]